MRKDCRRTIQQRMISALNFGWSIPMASRLVFLVWLVVFVVSGSRALCQEENALPPGPARLHGTLRVDGELFENAVVLFFYMRNGLAHSSTYKSDAAGRFTVYLYDEAREPAVVVFLNSHVRCVFEPHPFLPGTNYYHTFLVDSSKILKLENKKYRKILRKLKL